MEDSTGSTTNSVAEPNSSEYRSIVNEFRAFLSDSKDVLDEATTMRLLERYVILLRICCTYIFKFFKILVNIKIQIIYFFWDKAPTVLFRTE